MLFFFNCSSTLSPVAATPEGGNTLEHPPDPHKRKQHFSLFPPFYPPFPTCSAIPPSTTFWGKKTRIWHLLCGAPPVPTTLYSRSVMTLDLGLRSYFSTFFAIFFFPTPKKYTFTISVVFYPKICPTTGNSRALCGQAVPATTRAPPRPIAGPHRAAPFGAVSADSVNSASSLTTLRLLRLIAFHSFSLLFHIFSSLGPILPLFTKFPLFFPNLHFHSGWNHSSLRRLPFLLRAAFLSSSLLFSSIFSYPDFPLLFSIFFLSFLFSIFFFFPIFLSSFFPIFFFFFLFSIFFFFLFSFILLSSFFFYFLLFFFLFFLFFCFLSSVFLLFFSHFSSLLPFLLYFPTAFFYVFSIFYLLSSTFFFLFSSLFSVYFSSVFYCFLFSNCLLFFLFLFFFLSIFSILPLLYFLFFSTFLFSPFFCFFFQFSPLFFSIF